MREIKESTSSRYVQNKKDVSTEEVERKDEEMGKNL